MVCILGQQMGLFLKQSFANSHLKKYLLCAHLIGKNKNIISCLVPFQKQQAAIVLLSWKWKIGMILRDIVHVNLVM